MDKNTQGKRYGLQAPQKPALGQVQPRLAAFADDSDSENEEGSDWVKKSFSKAASQSVQKKQTKLEIQKALKQDPTVYQYDEIYDQLEEKKQETKSEKNAQERKPRYIQTLIVNAEQRKREQERRNERSVQKEREAEGDAFKDKESFITESYRKKLEEYRIQDEEERRLEELEAIGDVSKQEDLSGFYRHLYHQTLGENKPTIKQEKNSDGEQELEVEKKQDEADIKPSTTHEDSNISQELESEVEKKQDKPDIVPSTNMTKTDKDSNNSKIQESEAEKKQDELNIKPHTSMKKNDEDSHIKTEESQIELIQGYRKGEIPVISEYVKERVKHLYTITVSPITGLIRITEVRSNKEEETSKDKPKKLDGNNKRHPLSEIPRKSVSEKHHSNENNQDADTDLSFSSSESDSDTENKSKRMKTEAVRPRRYRRRRSCSSSESTSESESEGSVHENRIDRENSADSRSAEEEKASALSTSSRPNEQRVTNGSLIETEKENTTNARIEINRENVPDPSI